MDLKAPIYFSTGLTEKANHYYKLFIPWTNQKIRKTFVQRNMFEFKHIKAFDRAFADSPGPMVCPGAAGGGQGVPPGSGSLAGCSVPLCWEDGRAEGSEGRGSICCPDCPHICPEGRVCNPGDAACWPVTTDLPEVGREREEHGEGSGPQGWLLGGRGCPG